MQPSVKTLARLGFTHGIEDAKVTGIVSSSEAWWDHFFAMYTRDELFQLRQRIAYEFAWKLGAVFAPKGKL